MELILNSKDIKANEKRKKIIELINNGLVDINSVSELAKCIDDKKLAIVLEAMEEITRTYPEKSTIEWLQFVEQYIDTESNSLKREASRIVGNIAHLYENDLESSIQKLLINTRDEGTVVRWGSAYALAKIIMIPQYYNSYLFEQLSQICEQEAENGVKNQYVKSLKKVAILIK